MTVLAALLVAVIGSLAIEALSAPRPISRRPAHLLVRAAAYGVITLFWFQFSWRPWLACATCLLTVAVAAMVNRLKREVIGESLVFSDLALLHQVPRHPELYYALPLSDARVAGLILTGTAIVALWYNLEPTVLPDGLLASVLAVLGLPLALLSAVLLARLEPVRTRLVAWFPRPDLEADVVRYGVFGTMIVYALRRGVERRAASDGGAEEARPAPRLPAACDDEVFVVVQLESFLDPARLGGPPLPLMERIRSQAAQYGALRVPSHGAYTMRSEHAVLTGLDAAALGFGCFDPYLANGGSDPTSLARLARAAGYATVFIHPYHRNFFNRAAVMTRLGFDRLVMQEDFAAAPRVGPYVCDTAVAERILDEVRGRSGKLFVFCVTMENHGPWKPGRLQGIDEPLSQYLHHVANTGRAAEMLIDGLTQIRATLCVFGDHPPSLPASRPGAVVPQTDYAIFRFGREPEGTPRRRDLTADGLGRALSATLIGRSERPAELSGALPPS